MAASLRSALHLYVFGMLGIFLLAVPWTAIWDRATLAMAPTWVGAWVRSGWFRGGVSALGLLDLAVAAREGRLLWRSLAPDPDPDGPPAA